MKTSFVLLLLCLFESLYGQNNTPVSGRTISTEGELLQYATITIHKTIDSVIVKSALSDSAGYFIFKSVPAGSYFVQVTSVGYNKYVSPAFTLSSAPVHLGAIQLTVKAGVLKDVKVQAEKPLIEQKVDRMVMNIENSILASGNNALELLQQAPYVSVDNNGNISLKGIQNTTVMIDGRLTYLSAAELANFLRNMPASQIATIDIIANPSSKYEAAGNGGIINIKMKKNLSTGLNGSFNTNLQQGRLPQISNGLNLNYRKGKFNLYSGINHSKQERWVEETTDLSFYNVATKEVQTHFNIAENTFYHSNSFNGRAGIDYSFSKKTIAGILLTAFSGGEDDDGNNANKIQSFSLGVDSSLQTLHSGISDWNRYSGNINLRHQFDSLGKVVSFDFDYADFRDRSNPGYLTSYYNGSGSNTGSTYLNANMGTGIKMASFKGDYEHPVNETLNFSAGFKWSRVHTLNAVNYYQNGFFDKRRSNDFDYTETINAAYADVSKEFKKASLKLGLRAEQTISNGVQLTQDSTFKKQYTQLFPTTFFRYKWNKDHSSGITINRRIGRPDYESLNPFIYLSDPYTSWGGNPYLQPALTRVITVSHNYKGMINVFVSYNQTTNALAQYQTRDTTTSGIFSTWGNLGKSEQMSAGLGTIVKLTKWWRMNNNLFVFNTMSSGQLGDVVANTSVTSYRIITNNNFVISKTFSAEMSYMYRPASLWGVSKTGPLGSLSVGVQAKILKENGSLKISGGDVFRTMQMNMTSAYAGFDSRYHSMSETQVIKIVFNYRFGRKQVKSERERTTALEDESGRVKGRD